MQTTWQSAATLASAASAVSIEWAISLSRASPLQSWPATLESNTSAGTRHKNGKSDEAMLAYSFAHTMLLVWYTRLDGQQSRVGRPSVAIGCLVVWRSRPSALNAGEGPVWCLRLVQMECNDAIILPFKYAHAHVLHSRYGYNKALPVANYQEEMTLEPIEADSQHFHRI